jgi:uncharacterized small protein (DUF1192 family)
MWALAALCLAGIPSGSADAEDLSSDVVARLERAIAARDAEIARLKAALNVRFAEQGNVVALGDPTAFRRGSGEMTPTSSLTRERGTQLAQLLSLVKRQSSYSTVLPTGSMKPLFDEKAVLLLEAAPFEDLKVGDIVTYRHPALGVPVVHRLVLKDGDKFWSKGDANGRMDNVYVTRENYLKRVYGVIYTSGP